MLNERGATSRCRASERFTVLDSVAAVRADPVGYLTTSEIIDSPLAIFLACGATPALENAMHRFASVASISIRKDGSAVVYDNGPGIGLRAVTRHGHTAAEDCLTVFPEYNRSLPNPVSTNVAEEIPISGIVCATALSEFLIYEMTSSNTVWRQRFERGRPVSNPKPIGPDEEQWQRLTFRPDPRIFGHLQIASASFIRWFENLPVSFHNAKITLNDERTGTKIVLNE